MGSLRWMPSSQNRIDHGGWAVRGQDEIGPPGCGFYGAVVANSGLHGSGCGCSDCNDSSIPSSRVFDSVSGSRSNSEALRLGRLVRFGGGQTSVEFDCCEYHAAIGEVVEHLLRERASRARHLRACESGRAALEDRSIRCDRPLLWNIRISNRRAMSPNMADRITVSVPARLPQSHS